MHIDDEVRVNILILEYALILVLITDNHNYDTVIKSQSAFLIHWDGY